MPLRYTLSQLVGWLVGWLVLQSTTSSSLNTVSMLCYNLQPPPPLPPLYPGILPEHRVRALLQSAAPPSPPPPLPKHLP